jgi:hypothetical protein
MKKRLTTGIMQTSDSCILISPIIILNYYTDKSGEDLFNYFLEEHQHLIQQGIKQGFISENEFTIFSPEQRFAQLNRAVYFITKDEIRFNNEYVANFFIKMATESKISICRIDVKNNLESIGNILKNEDAFLSYTYPPIAGKYHAIQFYSINAEKGIEQNHGSSLSNIKADVNAADIGDGILFRRIR